MSSLHMFGAGILYCTIFSTIAIGTLVSQRHSPYEALTAFKKSLIIRKFVLPASGLWGSVREMFQSPPLPDHIHRDLITDILPSSEFTEQDAQSLLAQVEFKFQGNQYTGLFQGAENAFANFWIPSELPEPGTSTDDFFLLVKMLRTGVPASNLIMQPYRPRGASRHFFSTMFISQIPGSSLNLDLSDMAGINENGDSEEDISFPSQVLLEPTDEFRYACPLCARDERIADSHCNTLDINGYCRVCSKRSLAERLVSIKAGTVIYSIFVLDSPVEEFHERHKIGEVTLKTPFTISTGALSAHVAPVVLSKKASFRRSKTRVERNKVEQAK